MKNDIESQPFTKPSAGLHWLRNSNEIIILSADLSQRWLLKEVEADIWDWLVQGFAHSRMIEMLSSLCSIDPAQSSLIIKNCILKLKDKDLLDSQNLS
jgi:hypothetical protein